MSEFRLDGNVLSVLNPALKIAKYLENNVRPDGRPLLRSRELAVSVGVLKSANGSAQVRIGDTIVVCGIKAVVARPHVQSPNQGWLVPNVDLPPVCGPKYKAGPPNHKTQYISENIDRLVKSSKLFELEELCIVPKIAVWALFADIVCIGDDGNIHDAAILSLIAALRTMRLPKATFDEDTGTVQASCTHFYTLDLVRSPISVTGGAFDATQLIVDPTSLEEKYLDTLITVSIDEDNDLCLLSLSGKGIDKESLKVYLKNARDESSTRRKILDQAVDEHRRI